MLSIKAVKSSAHTSKYFSQADYYTKDKDSAIQSNWFGEAASALGLEGKVSKEALKDMLDGKLPNGEQLGRVKKDGTIEHQKGWDLTLSAPKSVSIMAFIAKDGRLLEAHAEAVTATLETIEKEMAVTRQSENGEIQYIKTGSLAVAQFTHTTSRALDPQLHTHNLVMNATHRPDGEWGSIESRNFYQNSKLLGIVYQNELAKRVKALGYGIEANQKKGVFEIAGLPAEVKQLFSKRRAEVEAAIKEHGYTTSKGFDEAAVRSRGSKKHMTEEELRSRWDNELAGVGYTPESLLATVSGNSHQLAPVIEPTQIQPLKPNDVAIDPADQPQPITPTVDPTNSTPEPAAIPEGNTGLPRPKPSPKRISPATQPQDAKGDVEFAYRNLAEREAVFTRTKLMETAMAVDLGRYTLGEINQAINTFIKEGSLIAATLGGEEAITTQDGLQAEQAIVKKMALGKLDVTAIASAKFFDRAIQGSGLNEGQSAAAKLILTTRDRFVGIQGYAGTGKTFMLDKVREIGEGKGYKLRGMAATGSAAEQLQNDSHIKSQTIASFLTTIRNGKAKIEKKELWTIDEASLINNNDKLELMTYAKHFNARIAFIGDVKQIGAIDAGKPFYQLQNAGMATAEMKEIRRQEGNATLLQAVYDSIDKAPEKALAKIRDTVFEIEDTDTRIAKIVEHYIKLTPQQRDDMLVLIPDNDTRKKVNEMIQEKLRASNEIGSVQNSFNVLVSQGMTDIEKSQGRFYRLGTFVQFGNDYKKLGVNRGEFLEVVNSEDGIVSLKRSNGDVIKWNPTAIAGGKSGKASGVETYNRETRTLSEGDLIRWKKTDKDRGLKNGYLGVIKNIEGSEATVTFKNKGEMKIDLKNNPYWDLGYATTIFSAQGATYKNVILNAESWRRNLLNLKTFYVGLSRAKENAYIYTDNTKELGVKTKQREGEKTSAIEGAGISFQSILDEKGLIKDTRSKDPIDAVKQAAQKSIDAVKKALRIGAEI